MIHHAALGRLNMEEIDEGLAALRVNYQERGYWDAKVRDPGDGQRDHDTGTVRMTVRIKEGLPRILAGVEVSNNAQIS